jgi:riboflavin synthase
VRTRLASELAQGDSLAVNGVCLTVTEADAAETQAEIGPETMRVTTLGRIAAGERVNLERPLRADSRVGGHFVQGHVDGVGYVEEVRTDGDCHWLTVSFPRALAPYLVRKGSVAVDGISLTVADLRPDQFDVQLVPFTLEHTTLRGVRVRQPVNLECDMLGKYVIRAVEQAGLAAWQGSPAHPA